ncbi:hypothetical protein [Catenulispora pinisilvae]|uniref:hypothetical protein n=1 Tax=Catenulispora pinisilvae TaxID=2705253 RepID=UPI0018925912|nr:hypothetical protein [Catenulispora pinisilvae]
MSSGRLTIGLELGLTIGLELELGLTPELRLRLAGVPLMAGSGMLILKPVREGAQGA